MTAAIALAWLILKWSLIAAVAAFAVIQLALVIELLRTIVRERRQCDEDLRSPPP